MGSRLKKICGERETISKSLKAFFLASFFES